MDFNDLSNNKLADLRYIAKLLKVKSITVMTKQELIEKIKEIKENEGKGFPVPEKAAVTEKKEEEKKIGNDVSSDDKHEIKDSDTAQQSGMVPKETADETKPVDNEEEENKANVQVAQSAEEDKEIKKDQDAAPENNNAVSEIRKSNKDRRNDRKLRDKQDRSKEYRKHEKKQKSEADNAESDKAAEGDNTNGKRGHKDNRGPHKKVSGEDRKNKNQENTTAEEVVAAEETGNNENVNETEESTEKSNNKNVQTKGSYYMPNPDSNKSKNDSGDDIEGILEVLPESYGFIRTNIYAIAALNTGTRDVYVAPALIRKFGLKTGDSVKGKSRPQRENDKYQALFYIESINGDPPEVAQKRRSFETLTPIYPDHKIVLETSQTELATRLIDIIAPIGKGQRGMIVSPPKAGKTVLLKKIANSIVANYPDIKIIVLLIDERPEEVTDMRESINGDVVSSTFDELPEKHIKVAEIVFERAQRLVEQGKDVVILMDSLTRLARAYNITIPPTGRSLSGGLDPGALYKPKRFFGAARNIREGGSLTIVATALIDTGSKMDDVIFEEFKGTGNMELHLDRKLSEKRIFPAIDINKSGTRKEELLLTEKEQNAVFAIRRSLSNLGTADVTEMIVNKMIKSKNNAEFIQTINIPNEVTKY